MFRISCRVNPAPLIGLLGLVALHAGAQENLATIEDGKQVSFTYTLTSEGELIESNSEREPMVYVQGGGQILPALESELAGMSAGQKKVVNLAAADAYGEINEAAFQEIPLEQIPEDARVAGTLLQAQGFPGPIRVAEIKDDVAVLDFNHPLAGKDLTFDIVIVAVEAAPPDPVAPVPAD
jgi:FKBP-type peptidyl-prolyl cis-trans isomerase SlyD